jgi:hypothetical protein
MVLALGYVLPFLTGQVPQVGMMLLPMHIPVFLTGLICGWKFGLGVGLLLPITRSFIFGMPMLFPMASAMAFELATYGLVVGFLYNRSRWQCVFALYRAIIIAMVSGRLVFGVAMWAFVAIDGGQYTLNAFTAAAVGNALPGIALQLVLLPSVMLMLNRTGLVPFRKVVKAEATDAQL